MWAEKGGTPPPPLLRDKDTQAFCSSDPDVRKCLALAPPSPKKKKKHQEAKLTFLPHPGHHLEKWVWAKCSSGLDLDSWLARPCGQGFYLCCCVNGDSRPWPLRGTAAASRTGRGAQKPTEQHLHVWKRRSQSQLRGEGLAVGTSHNSPPPLPLGVRYSPVYWTCSGRAHSGRPEEGLRAPQPQDGDPGT